ncbi:MAG: TIGR04282 family arsenosugar biosynthesis glycosyltransferase [Bacteroidia bacterium]|nr:TIGR04282 family arsenosugar biosynthesis glycosyltransferase [Bacteroidia bacterium]
MANIRRLTAILAKAPIAGRVKTRLMADYPYPDRIADLAGAFLTDTDAVVSHPSVTVRPPTEVILCHDGDPTVFPDALRRRRAIPQRGNSLGDRIVSLCADVFADGAEQLSIVGSDCPHLPTAFLTEAFGRLSAGAEAVFGPTDDGGYYLVALSRPLPVLFEKIPWSTSDVLRTTLETAEREGIRTALLPGWYDIDTGDDLRRLRTDLRRGVAFAPATAAVLESVFGSFPWQIEKKGT